jgi:hypothetical protein
MADDYLKNQPVPGLFCHAEYLGRKVREVTNFDWSQLDLSDVVAGTSYPQP